MEILAVHQQTGERNFAHCDDDEEEKYQAAYSLVDALGVEFEN